MIGRCLLALVLTGLAGAASADMMSVTESASYPMSDEDSRKDGRQHCVEAAKHTALDRAGSVFESELNNERSESGRDEARLKMRSYFAGVVSSEMVGDRIDVDPQGRATENCTVRIGYDPETVTAKMHEIADAEGLRKQVAQQQITIAGLQDQVRLAQQPPLPAAAPTPQVVASALPPPGFEAPPQMQAAPAAAAPVYAAPHALVPPLAPAAVAAPAPRVYGPPPAALVAVPPAPAPRPVVYYAPAPPPAVVYYAPRPVVLYRPRPVRFKLVRRRVYWP